MDEELPFERCLRTFVRHRRAFETFTRPATELILERIEAAPTGHVLDVASGIGDPALALAEVLKGRGTVTATDRVRPFLHALRAEATARGLSGLRVLAADMQSLPLAAATVDSVVSRLGIALAPDPLIALTEARRVLKPGGRAIYVVWGQPDQPLLNATVHDVLAACGAPALRDRGPFQFARGGSLASALRAVGFCDVRENILDSEWRWPGNARSLWEVTRETSAPVFAPLFEALEPERLERLESEVVQKLEPYTRGDCVALPVELRWVEGQKPTD